MRNMTHKLPMNTKLNWLSIVICESLILYLFILKGRTLKWPWQGRRQKPWLADTLQLQSNWQACSRHMGVKKKNNNNKKTAKWIMSVHAWTQTHTGLADPPLTHTHTHMCTHTNTELLMHYHPKTRVIYHAPLWRECMCWRTDMHHNMVKIF